jgi:hypothetical protein
LDSESRPGRLACPEHRELWTFTTDVLSSPKLCRSGFMDEAALRNVIAQHASGADNSRLLSCLTVLELSLP